MNRTLAAIEIISLLFFVVATTLALMGETSPVEGTSYWSGAVQWGVIAAVAFYVDFRRVRGHA